MIETKWFISSKTISPTGVHEHKTVITDVSPALWFLYRKVGHHLNHHILYAEEISPALAAELIHTAKIQPDYYREVDDADL